jgi:hypothetical protein
VQQVEFLSGWFVHNFFSSTIVSSIRLSEYKETIEKKGRRNSDICHRLHMTNVVTGSPLSIGLLIVLHFRLASKK